MRIYIADISQRKGDLYKQAVNDFFTFLREKGIELNNIELLLCDVEVIEELKMLNYRSDNMCEAVNDYFSDLNYLGRKNTDFKSLNQLFMGVDNRDIAIIIIGDLKTINHYGDAKGICAVITNDNPKNIWHEIAHIFGAKDHYEENELPSSYCKSSNCLMCYDNLDGEFCEVSLNDYIAP
mgnify:CR=1 FL=1